MLIASKQFPHCELELEETTKPSQQILAQHQISFIFHTYLKHQASIGNTWYPVVSFLRLMVFQTTFCTTAGTTTHLSKKWNHFSTPIFLQFKSKSHFIRQATAAMKRARRAASEHCFAERLSSRCKYLFSKSISFGFAEQIAPELYLLAATSLYVLAAVAGKCCWGHRQTTLRWAEWSHKKFNFGLNFVLKMSKWGVRDRMTRTNIERTFLWTYVPWKFLVS